jgi:maltooligosyltrehalose synthase
MMRDALWAAKRVATQTTLRGPVKVLAKGARLMAEDLLCAHSTKTTGRAAMAKTIPLTNFVTYMAEAKAIRRDLRNSTGSPAAVRKAVEDLADLAATAMEEAAQVFEGLAMTVLALHPDVTRAPQREKRAPRSQAARRP